MSKVVWHVEGDDTVVQWVAGDATVVQLPNFPGAGTLPPGSINATLAHIWDNSVRPEDVLDPTDYEQRLGGLEQSWVEDAEARTQLANQVSELVDNPSGIQAFAYDEAGRVVLTLLTGETKTTGLPPATNPTTPASSVFVGPTEPTEPYTLWYQTDAEGELLGIYVPDEAP